MMQDSPPAVREMRCDLHTEWVADIDMEGGEFVLDVPRDTQRFGRVDSEPGVHANHLMVVTRHLPERRKR